MADEMYDENGNQIQDPGDEDQRQWVQDLRKQAKEAKAAKAEAEAARKELAFHKAGIPDDGPGKLFRKAYDGETSEDAIKASALEYGVIQNDGGAGSGPGPEEQAAVQRAAQATAGASAPPPPDLMEQLDAVDAQRWKSPQEHSRAVQAVMVRNGIWSGETVE